MKKLFNGLRVNEKVSFVINGLTELCPPMTSTIGNPAFRDFLKSQKAYCTVDQYW